ncbi:hypothetical protein [Rhodoflexus sp.]
MAVLVLLCIGLSATTATYYKQVNELNKDLQATLARIKTDSLAIQDYRRSEDQLRGIFAKYAPSSSANDEKPNVLIGFDTLLAAYISRTNDLYLLSEQGKKQIEDYRNEIVFFKNKIQSLEDAKSESEHQIELLTSDIVRKTTLSDSMAAALELLHYKLLHTNIDSMTIISPKGNKIFYYGKLFEESPQSFGIGFYEGRGYYIGEWKGNARNGWGKHFYKDGSSYEGYFENDLRSGYGTYYYATGEIYKGNWKDDLMNGEGEIIGADRRTVTGIWENGKLLLRK